MAFKFLLCFCLVSVNLFGQKSMTVRVFGLTDVSEINRLEKNSNFKNYLNNCNDYRLEMIESGYLTCQIDSIVKDDSLKTAKVYFYLGEKFNFSQLTFGKNTKLALQETEGLEFWNRKIRLRPKRVRQMMEAVLSYYENHGYPFVTCQVTNLSWDGNILLGDVLTDTGPLFKVGELIVKSKSKVDGNLIENILDIHSGDLFSIEKIDNIEKEIKELVYYDLVKPSEYEFINNKVNVYVYLKEKNANSFNAILGVLPSDNGTINITGDAKIKLQNALKKGELIYFNWRKLLPLTQNLNVQFKYPYLFKSSFGVDARFDLYKKDTSYLDLNTRLGVSYAISPLLKVNLFYNNRSSSLLSTEKYKYVSTLPEFADVRTNSYGVSMTFENLNYLYNPVRGWDVRFEFGIGDKLIKKNVSLNQELYDNLVLKSLQFNLNGNVNRFFKIKKRSTIMLGLQGGWISGDNIFENELFRIGGQRTLRGFDDESIFASSFAIGTLEYRFILEENSNLFLFTQGMYYDKDVLNSYLFDTPYSFGLGINFQTKPGIFSVSYSLGSQLGNPILLRSAKIHFGFVNYF